MTRRSRSRTSLGSAFFARAQAPADKQEALGSLHEGNRSFDAGDYQGALSRYKQAYARVPSPKFMSSSKARVMICPVEIHEDNLVQP